MMERDCDLRQRPIYRSQPPSQAVRHLEKRFGPLPAKALTSEISVSSPRPEGASQSLLAFLGVAGPAAAPPVVRTEAAD